MVKRQETYRDLLMYCMSLDKIRNSPDLCGLAKLFSSRINEFHRLNKEKIMSINETIAKLDKEYFVLDENGRKQVVESNLVDDKGNKAVPTFKMQEGKTYEMFTAAHNEFFNKPCYIEV